MIKVFTNYILAFALIVSIFIIPGGMSAADSNGLSKGMLEGKNNVYKLNDNLILIKLYNELSLIDLTKGKAIKKIKIDENILDIHVMTNPNKIIILAQTSSKKIQKRVFNDTGVELSKLEYPLNISNETKVKYVSPANGINERLMIQEGHNFALYQTPWKKPVVVFDAKIKDLVHEYINVNDWDYRSYPYLAIKYAGERIMATDYYVRIVNLYTKKTTDLNTMNTDFDMKINAQNSLELSTSYNYEELVPPNAPHPNPTEEQKFHILFSLAAGKETQVNKLLFKQRYDHISGWETEVVGGTVFVQDLETNLWSLYQSNGSAIASNQSGLGLGSKFLNYNSQSHTAYFLVVDKGTLLPVIKSLQIS
jgi:hypothetical protein